MSSKTVSVSGDDLWLKEEDPDLYYMLRALDGDQEASLWLETSSHTIYLLSQAASGDQEALNRFATRDRLQGEDLAGLIGLSNGISRWLSEKYPQVHALFEAIKGDANTLRQLKRDNTRLAQLAEAARPLYESAQESDLTSSLARGPQAGELDALEEDEVADVGCLIGEMHLRQGEYHKAIDAFTRAIEGSPTADAFEGRSRAYSKLAALDMDRAQQLRQL